MVASHAMPYITGGAAYRNTNVVWNYELGTGDATTQTFGLNAWDWTVGADVEVAHSEHLSWKVEYLYSDFGSKFEPSARVSDDEGGPGVRYSDIVQMLRFGVNIRLH
jgi:opacity protein-like surface antigen